MRLRVAIAASVGLAALAAASLTGHREPVQRPADHAEPNDQVVALTPGVAAHTESMADGGSIAPEHGAAEVRAMSPTFRNSTFLVAIRAAGFYCDDVESASESVDGVWVASCADKSGYTLGVLEANRFDVHPIPHFFDGLPPKPFEPDPTFELER